MKIDYKELVKRYIRNHYTEDIVEIERLTTGLCHYVYSVKLKNSAELVIRIAREGTAELIKSGVYWNNYLTGLDLPIPKLLHSNIELETPYMILSKIEGRDLCYVYDELTGTEKMNLARDIVSIQDSISKLQPNDHFGYAEKYFDEKLQQNTSWKQVIQKSIMSSKKRIEETNIFDLKLSEFMLSQLQKFDSYFEKINPKPFLDDITTKNVLIHNGKLSGIVDIDEVCFGDKLFHLALTRMALLSQNSDADYIDFIIDEYNLDIEELKVLDFYTTVCCLDFMSETGQRFNKDTTPEIDQERVKFLESVFYKYYNSDNVMKTDLMRYGESCLDFFNENIITDLIRVVKQGKEATVVCCKSHESMDSGFMAVKLYKEKKFRNFKRDSVYHIGRVWDQRLIRAIKKNSTKGQNAERASWVSNEYNCLDILYDAGVKVPKPIAYTNDAIVMEFLGEEDVCSALLKETRFSNEEAQIAFDKIIRDIEIMLKNEIVHGDLSPYNILYHNGEPYIIDFPQAVNPSINTYAYDLLERDVANVCKYFRKYSIESNHQEITQRIWTPLYGKYFNDKYEELI